MLPPHSAFASPLYTHRVNHHVKQYFTSSTSTLPSRSPQQKQNVHPCNVRCTIIKDNDSDNTSTLSTSKRDRVLQDIMLNLKETLPNIFRDDVDNDYSKYSSQVEFEDPLTKFRGVQRHAANIEFLNKSFLFSNAQIFNHDIKILPSPANIIRCRWTLYMTLTVLPWKPRIYFTGISDYYVDIENEKITRHVDYWDSIDNSAYFSVPGLKHLISLCSPSHPVPLSLLPRLIVLRSLPDCQIWQFTPDVTIAPLTNSTTPNVYAITSSTNNQNTDDSNSETLQYVAVLPLSDKIPSETEVADAVSMLTQTVNALPYAMLGTKFFCTKIDCRTSPVYHVWAELSDVKTEVSIDQFS